jgi:hypothetical protein
VAVGENSTEKKGRLSTIIRRLTSSGWLRASSRPVKPPIEWPITAGDFRCADLM